MNKIAELIARGKMNAPARNESAGECPPSATLASFIDGMLAADQRVAVAKHVADCPDCYEAFAGTVSMEPTEEKPKRHASWWLRIGSIAAATLIAGVLSILRISDPLRPVIIAAAALPQRPIEPRLHGFPDARWDILRGSSDTALFPTMKLRRTAARIALRKGSDARTLHARGVAALLLGDKQKAIRDLAAAADAEPRNAGYRSDLAAAYLELGQSDGPALASALQASDRALAIDHDLPEAAFNRALALEKLGRVTAAIEAYDRYLRLDPTSPVSQDAARSRNRLTHIQHGS